MATIGFAAIGAYFTYKLKHQPSFTEIQEREKIKMHKTISAIKTAQLERMRTNQGTISGLPNWENEYDTIMNAHTLYR
jgi:transcription initiation factor TFIIIB Brf1 subunit/transcription initiation factor TFIIB